MLPFFYLCNQEFYMAQKCHFFSQNNLRTDTISEIVSYIFVRLKL
jgi:hypothetical protein